MISPHPPGAGPDGESPEARERRILEERAAQLARPLAEPDPGEVVHLVTFGLGGERFALETRFAREVVRVRSWAPLPGAVPPLAGLTAWRGDLLTLYDLGTALGQTGSGAGEVTWVLIVDGARSPFGVPIDAPGEFLTLPAAELRSPPEELSLERGWIHRLAPQDLRILDGDRLLRLHS